MNKEYLINNASHLDNVDKSTSDEYNSKIDGLVIKMNDLMASRSDIKQLIGSNNVDMMKDNHANHARFIDSIMKNYNSEVLVNTILWVFNAYQNHGFSSNYWAAQLNAWISILKDELSEKSYSQVYPFYEWMQVNIPGFVEASRGIENNPHD